MPVYDYYCRECGHEEEHIHGMKEEVKFSCPKCTTELRVKIGTFEYTIGTGGTRNRSYRERYGNPKHKDSTPTPEESAQSRAQKKSGEIGKKSQEYDPSNPYGNIT